ILNPVVAHRGPSCKGALTPDPSPCTRERGGRSAPPAGEGDTSLPALGEGRTHAPPRSLRERGLGGEGCFRLVVAVRRGAVYWGVRGCVAVAVQVMRIGGNGDADYDAAAR